MLSYLATTIEMIDICGCGIQVFLFCSFNCGIIKNSLLGTFYFTLFSPLSSRCNIVL